MSGLVRLATRRVGLFGQRMQVRNMANDAKQLEGKANVSWSLFSGNWPNVLGLTLGLKRD